MSITSILDAGLKILDKVIPDPKAKQEAQLKLLELQQQGEFKELEASVDLIKVEASSNDPWTSRARPSFLYVMYVMLLAGIPMGVLHALNPSLAAGVVEGFKLWLAAIPDELYALFGAVSLGYVGARSWEKVKGASK